MRYAIMEWFDPYEIRARIVPSIIVCLPLIITLLTIASEISGSLFHLLGSGVALIVLIYALSFLVRHYGKKIEPDLWAKWDGPPSTRFMRWRDQTWNAVLKHQFHAAVERICGIKLKSKKEEADAPVETDQQIAQAFLQVKAIVRRDEPEGVWTKHNAEYGFHRNLLGSRGLWLMFSILGAAICGVVWNFTRADMSIVGFTLNIVLVVGSILWGWHFLPKFVKDSANRYSESVWNSFLVSAKRS